MSLFRSREWWSVNLNEAEMYDLQCLLVLKLEKDQYQSILIGSHEGFLRLYSPSSQIVDGEITGYKPSHLLLEVQLSAPVLQIKEGTLVSGSKEKFVAVLHPRLLSVYALRKKEGSDKNVGHQMVIELVYQHVLRHSAHSLVLGPFGGVRGRDFICIQSLDGLLSFYEQESFAFQIYLPTFMLPFTFTYIEKTDSFLFLNGLLIFNCYAYEALASAGNSADKKIMKTWEFNWGEGIVDIQSVTKDGALLIILSEKNFCGLNEKGKMIFTKRLEYRPVALCSYVTEESKKLMVIIATDGGFLNLYEETSLKWSMKIEQVPVSVNRIFVSDLSGGIVFLTENGFLQIVYIGTFPSVYLVPPLVQSEINFSKAELELKELQQKIADNDFQDPVTADLISADLNINKTFKIENGVKMCNAMVEINAQCPVKQIKILFVVESPLSVTNQSFIITNCSEKTFVDSWVYLKALGIVSDLTITVIITYISVENLARSIQKTGVLPLSLVVTETTAVKEAQYKITISTNKPICEMNQLFQEFSTDEATPNAIGLKFINSGDVVTVLGAKSSQRYRLQSDCLAPISLLLCALIDRLKNQFRKNSDFSLNYSTSLPFEIFFESIERHHSLLQRKKSLEQVLATQTSQYRTVQKKILSNLKDVTPKPASNLPKILNYTYQKVLTTVNELEKMEDDLFLSKCNLSSLNRILLTLIQLMGVGEEDMKILNFVLNPHVYDSEEQGWLEVQQAASSFLLRTVLAKSIKDKQKSMEIVLEPLKDTKKLVKHFLIVIDRVTKGTHLIERTEFENKKEPLMAVSRHELNAEEIVNDNEMALPPGSKFFSSGNQEDKVATVDQKNERTLEIMEQVKEESKETEKEIEEVKNFKKVPSMEGSFEEVPQPNVIKAEERKNDDDDDDDDDAIWDVTVGEMRI